jgi:hypothetical protein
MILLEGVSKAYHVRGQPPRWVLRDTAPTGPPVKVPPHNLKGESAAWVDEKLEEEVR